MKTKSPNEYLRGKCENSGYSVYFLENYLKIRCICSGFSCGEISPGKLYEENITECGYPGYIDRFSGG